MDKAGYTFIEMLCTMCLLAILLGISSISYNSWNVSLKKKDLHTSGKVFAMAVKNCLANYGAWEINHPVAGSVKPCEADSTELKDRLNFTCPKDATCETYSNKKDCSLHGNPESCKKVNDYYCLSILKRKSGQNFQVITQVNRADPSKYNIWCGHARQDPAQDVNCKRGASRQIKMLVMGSYSGTPEQCDW